MTSDYDHDDNYGRASSRRRGHEAEERMYAILRDYGPTQKLGNINPDFLLHGQISLYPLIPPYAIECKSIVTHAKDYVGRIKITRSQWEETLERSDHLGWDATPLVMVEVNVRGSPIKIYYLLSNQQVMDKMGENSASFTVWEIVKIGFRLDF